MSESVSKDPVSEPLAYAPGSTTIWNNSWRHIYEQFSQAIIAYARRRGLNDHSAEDVLQEVMMTLIRCQHGQEPGHDSKAGHFQAWLWGVIRNRVRTVRRKDQKEEIAAPLPAVDGSGEARNQLPEVPQPPPDFEQMEEDQWQQALLAAAMQQMRQRVSPENFAIFTGLLEEKSTPEQLAEQLGKKRNAIDAANFRCKAMLLDEARRIRETWEQLRQSKPLS